MGIPTRSCPGCGLEMPAGGVLYDGYYNASPECWSVYGEVLAAEFGNSLLFGQVHQMTVDAYAVQHAGLPHPDKSVCVHLVGLHLMMERGIRPRDVPRRLQRLASVVASWPHLPPPKERGPFTVYDVAVAESPKQHASRVQEWAAQEWRRWSPHQGAVAELARKCLPAP